MILETVFFNGHCHVCQSVEERIEVAKKRLSYSIEKSVSAALIKSNKDYFLLITGSTAPKVIFSIADNFTKHVSRLSNILKTISES